MRKGTWSFPARFRGGGGSRRGSVNSRGVVDGVFRPDFEGGGVVDEVP